MHITNRAYYKRNVVIFLNYFFYFIDQVLIFSNHYIAKLMNKKACNSYRIQFIQKNTIKLN